MRRGNKGSKRNFDLPKSKNTNLLIYRFSELKQNIEEQTSFSPSKRSSISQLDQFSEPFMRQTRFIQPFTRINRDLRETKQLGFFINDSSYLNASDPNSMRDQGMIRNAQYNICNLPISPLQSFTSSSHRTTRSRLMSQSLQNWNKTLYSFGGHSPSKKSHLRTFSINHQNQLLEPPTLVRVSDYTKNISESLFSPGLTTSKIKHSRNTLQHGNMRKSQKIVRSLFSEIKDEKERTRSIGKEISEIKRFMARLKQRINMRQ